MTRTPAAGAPGAKDAGRGDGTRGAGRPRAAAAPRRSGRSGPAKAANGAARAKTSATKPPAGGVLTDERPASDQAAATTRPRRVVRPVRRWPWILGAVLVVAAVVAAGVILFFTPILGLRSVIITAGSSTGSDGAAVAGGTLDPTVDAVIRAAVQVPDGTPLARVDLSGVADRVRDVAQVEAVSVGRSWPNALTLTVTPRVPVAVTSANGQLWLMDAQGVAYLPVPSAPAGLMTVKLATPGPGDPATEAALTVIESFTDAFRGQVASVSARTGFDVELTLTDGRTVIWGGADQSARKMQVLPAVLERKGSQYDITDPSLVSVR